MTDSDGQGSRLRHEERSSTYRKSPGRSARRSGSVATRYDGILFRSWLEARWHAFFKLAGVVAEYEPEERPGGWWPDFRVHGITVEDKQYTVLAEVKPVVFSPIIIDRAFDKALREKWTLLLGNGPDGDFVGFLACKRDGVKTMGVRLTDSGLEVAALNRRDYGSWAERLWRRAAADLPNPGVVSAINRIIERQMGKQQFHFPGDKHDLEGA